MRPVNVPLSGTANSWIEAEAGLGQQSGSGCRHAGPAAAWREFCQLLQQRAVASRDPLRQGNFRAGANHTTKIQDCLDDRLEIPVVARHDTAENIGVTGHRVRFNGLGETRQVSGERLETALLQLNVYERKNRESQGRVIELGCVIADNSPRCQSIEPGLDCSAGEPKRARVVPDARPGSAK